MSGEMMLVTACPRTHSSAALAREVEGEERDAPGAELVQRNGKVEAVLVRRCP